VATDARSVWVKVKYRRPFSGVPSVTTLSCTPAFASIIAATALSIPTLSVGAISAVLAVVITVIFAVIKLLLRVVIKVELLCLIRANSGTNRRS